MNIAESIQRQRWEWEEKNIYLVYKGYRPTLYIGRESWNMLRAEIGEFIGFVRCAEKNNSFDGMDVVILDKKFHLEVK